MTLNEHDERHSDTNAADSHRETTVDVQQGWDVIGASGEKVGEIAQLTESFFVVSKGFFFPTDRYIPFSAISRVDDEKVFLNLTKDEIDDRGWSNPDAVRHIDDDVTGTRASDVDTEVPAARLTIGKSDYTTDPTNKNIERGADVDMMAEATDAEDVSP